MAKGRSKPDLLGLTLAVIGELNSRGIEFALAGGIVADIYRGEARATADLDVLVAIEAERVAEALEIVHGLGFTPQVATEEMLRGETRFARRAKRGTPQIIVGRNKDEPYGLDFLLLSLPWATKALDRAKSNRIMFPGLPDVPCVTVEDLLISKLFALKNSSERRYKKYDIPDVALIMQNKTDLDLNYLMDRMEELGLVFPRMIEATLPPLLARLSRRLRKGNPALDF